eukprot:TRINITY_DN20792_c0_g1_i2.p1 TRINITY_DN20792_c0_g1~~TRINITY_DN20792_c0_g1_i2.p1  ORF type:complete len:241 (+),score=17.41 TRINITY_DN20792_c0_g1_i2:29-751(+)
MPKQVDHTLESPVTDAINSNSPHLYSLNQSPSSITNPKYWETLCPEMHVSTMEHPEPIAFTDDRLGSLRQKLLSDGYFTLRNQDLPPLCVDPRKVATSILELKSHGWHPNFITMYDEPWLLAHQLAAVLEGITGNKLNYDWLAYCIEPPDGAGMPPHRDFVHCPPTSFHEDGHLEGVPRICTVWLSLGDSQPENSCLYFLPANKDSLYLVTSPNETARDVLPSDVSLQDIVAVPLHPGEM